MLEVDLRGALVDKKGCREFATVFITVTVFCCLVAFAVGYFVALAAR